MNIENLREYCLNKKGTTESCPFGEHTLVFKVANKMYALTNLVGELTLNLKCEPEKAIELREEFSYVLPGYHMNKKHWNTIQLDELVPDKLLMYWIDESYELVVGSLTKKQLEELKKIM
ncbi:MAG: MmcQ/YjbR family DNA-binding protein [Prolixibacteraceae bacterium]